MSEHVSAAPAAGEVLSAREAHAEEARPYPAEAPHDERAEESEPRPERPEFARLRSVRERAHLAARQGDVSVLGQAVHDLVAFIEDLMRLGHG
jgi:hypothetical protein